MTHLIVLKTERLLAIAELVRKYVPTVQTIGCFARVTDVTLKSDSDLTALAQAGYDSLTIGIETGDGGALRFMNKGYAAAVCNQLHPQLIGANMLTIYPDSELYQEIQRGNWQEENEVEKYREIRMLIENLDIPTQFAALGASNAFQLHGSLPEDKAVLIASIDKIIDTVGEEKLRDYRKNLRHL